MARPGSQAITTVSQWLACAHRDTTVLPAGADPDGVGIVAIGAAGPTDVPIGPPTGDPRPAPGLAGLVVGPDCRVYHAVPEAGRIERVVWDADTGTTPASGDDVLAVPPVADLGEFRASGGATPTEPRSPRAVALALAGYDIGDADHLVALEVNGDLLALDLAARRLVRRVRLVVPPPATPRWTVVAVAAISPVDLATAPGGVLVACASRAHPLWRYDWHGDPIEVEVAVRSLVGLPAGALPSRVAADRDGRIWLLWRAADGPAWATPVVDERVSAPCGPLPGATDVELDGSGALVVAAEPGADLRVFRLGGGAVSEDRPLRAARADGRGLTRTPDGRIGYWTAAGLRSAFGATVRYRPEGMVHTTALDSGVFRQRWGRLFIDACVPPGTSVQVAMTTSDDLPGDEFDVADPIGPLLGDSVTIQRTAPVNVPSAPVPDPTVLPLPAVESVFVPDRPVFRRGDVEQPWVRRPGDDAFVTYEAPVNAPAGRYLWLRLHLAGTPQRTPRVRALRVQTSGPRLLERLPRVYTEDANAAAFLDRYLQLLNVTMADAEAAAQDRHVLLDPASAPPEMLPWLASLIGLVLDRRWPEPARRKMIAAAVCLFRRRGTVGALLDMSEIVLGVRPVLVERFRFRGLTGGVGRTLVRAGSTFEQYAHRFSVVVPGAPSTTQLDILRELLDVHRPAHTIFEICSATTGSRLGLGMHLDQTAVIGRGSGFGQVTVGGVLGRGDVLGRPAGGLRIGSGGLGRDARVEP